MLEDVGLQKKEDTLAKYLSGGQKRKLCLGVALIGDPKVCNPLLNILLEEPPFTD